MIIRSSVPGARAGAIEGRDVIRFDRNTFRSLDDAISREWLETNGLGGFAGSTLVGANTRRYHGLLMAATKPPVGRTLLLSKLEETLVIGEQRYELSTNEYSGAVHPRGFDFLVDFRLTPFPVFGFEVNGVRLEKCVFMLHGENTTVISYAMSSTKQQAIRLELCPLIAFRDYHALTHENNSLDPTVATGQGLVSFCPYAGLPRLFLAHNAAEAEKTGYWYRNFFYRVEQERGLDANEDLFNPLVLRYRPDVGERAIVIASTEAHEATEEEKYRQAEIRRRQQIRQAPPIEDDFVQDLAVAADQFLVKRDGGATVIAGYPWFADWGRDTMIALPGLTLFTGKADIAKQILQTFAKYEDRGMLPNRFPDQGEAAEYNSVDAALWFFEAVRAYGAKTGDREFLRALYPVLAGMIEWHVRGTRYGIRMLDNGLLNAGEAGVQLTWMDAKIGDWVVTPRSGHPVEVQALWHNALRIMEEMAERFGDEAARKSYSDRADLVSGSFNRLFWNEAGGCLYDVIHDGSADDSIRPNQIFAVSLPYSMLAPDRARKVVQVVERELLTPYGLRTLNPLNPAYKPRYQGTPYERDSAYHQGTVWPWLLGPFVTAYIKVNGGGAEARRRGEQMLNGLKEQMSRGCVGQLSEIYDGSEPQRPRGCFAQAWSVAEVLRMLCDDVYRIKAGKPDGGF